MQILIQSKICNHKWYATCHNSIRNFAMELHLEQGYCPICLVHNRLVWASSVEQQYDLPILIGTPKQIEWARIIRAEFWFNDHPYNETLISMRLAKWWICYRYKLNEIASREWEDRINGFSNHNQ